jgi:hypothetical protein
MPENSSLQRKDELDKLLAPYGARRLSKKRCSALPGAPEWVWEIETDILFRGELITLQLRYQKLSPFELPSVYVSRPDILPCELPHVERDGKLCVWPDTYRIDHNDSGYALALLEDAWNMLMAGIKGELRTDFFDEFQNYWIYHCKSSLRVVSLCNIQNLTPRIVSGYRTRTRGLIVADSADELTSWLDNQQLLTLTSDDKRKTKLRQRQLSQYVSVLFLPLVQPWLPEDYPGTISALLDLIRREHESPEELIQLLGQAIACRGNSTPVTLVTFPVSTGQALAAVEIPKGFGDLACDRYSPAALPRHRFGQHSLIDGFRDVISLDILIKRLGNLRLNGMMVERADNDWMMGRDQNPQHRRISDNCIAIIGCGSVGSSVARLLLQSGIRKLMLWDDDLMKSENCSRHLLGYDMVGQKKATALAARLRKEFPASTVEAFECQWGGGEYDDAITRADIILSCTADWNTEQWLLNQQSVEVLGPVVFAFVEAHALAGHVVVNPVDSGAFNAWYYLSGKQTGALKLPVTHWPGETRRRVAACAGEFQPYGSVPLSNLHALAARTVLDLCLSEEAPEPVTYTFIGRHCELAQLGGQWNPDWVHTYGDPGYGDRILTFVMDNDGWVQSGV